MDTSSLKNLINWIINLLVDSLVPLIVTGIIFVFIYNVAQYVYKGDDPRERQNAIKYMWWSIVGLFLIFSLWGIMALLRSEFGISSPIPLFPEA